MPPVPYDARSSSPRGPTLAAAALLLTFARSAHGEAPLADPVTRSASALPALRVERGPGALDCPDASVIAGDVARRVGRPALDPAPRMAAPDVFRVELARNERLLRAHVVATGAQGGERWLEDVGTDCRSLAEAVSLSLAILLETEPDDSLADVAMAPAEGRPAAARLAARADVELGIETGAAAAVGILPSAGAAATTELDVRLRALSVAGGAWVAMPQSVALGAGSVSVGVWGATARVCWEPLGTEGAVRAGACALGLAGALLGRATGYDDNGAASRPWGAVGAGAVAHGPIAGPIEWSLRIAALALVSRESLSVDGVGPALEPSPVAALGVAGIRAGL